MKKTISILLAFVLLLGISGCGSGSTPNTIKTPGSTSSKPPLPPNDYGIDLEKRYFTYENIRDDVAYSDMEYERYEYSYFEEAAAAIYDFAENGGTAEDFNSADLTIYWQLYYIYTMLTMADLEYTRNPNSAETIAELDYMEDVWYKAWDEYWNCFHALAVSEYSEYMSSGFAEWQTEWLRQYDPSTSGTDSESLSEESTLVQQYYTLISETEPDYEAIVDVFVELVDLRNELAELYGYDSYAEFAYGSLYARDYSPQDSQELWSAIKEYFAPVMREYESAVYDITWDLWASDEIDCSKETILDAMELILPNISTEAYEAFLYMLEYELYDFELSDERMDTGYTTMLYYYNEPYVINSLYGDYYDYSDTFHEFGHFLNAFYIPSDLIFGTSDNDLCELQSQGMEILFTLFYDDIFGEENGEIVRADLLMSMVYSIVSGAMYDEFQQRVYAEENLTNERVLEIYEQLYEEYGYTPYVGYEYEWTGIVHNFQYPFYYISYGVSAIPALELYSLLQDSPADAVDEYMTIVAIDPEVYYYSEAIAESALSDPFAAETIRDIATSITETFAALIS